MLFLLEECVESFDGSGYGCCVLACHEGLDESEELVVGLCAVGVLAVELFTQPVSLRCFYYTIHDIYSEKSCKFAAKIMSDVVGLTRISKNVSL